jgi:hypothetical protein
MFFLFDGAASTLETCIIGFGFRHYLLISVNGNKGVNPERVRKQVAEVNNMQRQRRNVLMTPPKGAGCAQTMLPTSFMLYFASK